MNGKPLEMPPGFGPRRRSLRSRRFGLGTAVDGEDQSDRRRSQSGDFASLVTALQDAGALAVGAPKRRQVLKCGDGVCVVAAFDSETGHTGRAEAFNRAQRDGMTLPFSTTRISHLNYPKRPAAWKAPLQVLMLGAILVLLASCASPKPNGVDSARVRQPESRIDEINLVAMPLAIDVDSAPGVDGFALKVYAVNRARPKAQLIESGTLDILMADGLLREASADSSRYRRVWSYSAEQLKGFAFSSVVGTGYRFALNWGTDQPRADKITVVVRYRPAQGPAILSAPSSITIPGK